MKKSIYYLAAALVATSAISCNIEQDMSTPLNFDAEEESVVYVQMMELNLNASTGEPSTRTVFEKDGNGLKTKWLATDKIGVVIPATVTTTVSSQVGSTTSQSYMGFPLSSPTLYGDDDRTAIFDGLIPGYMKVTQTLNGVKTVTETTLTAGSVLAFYPSLTPSNVSAVISSTGTTATTIQYLNLNKTYSIGEQTGELKDLGEYAVMTSTGTLGISLQTSNGQRIQVGSITDAMQFKQKVAVLHIDHMWLGLKDDLDLSQGLTLTFSGAGIGKSFAINSSTGQMTTTAGNIVVTLTGDDVYEVQETDWDEEKGRYVLPEGCEKVILWDPSEADMDGGTYYLEDLYIAFMPKSIQAGAELSLTATGTGYGADFQGEYLWSARTAYQAGKVYHLRDKMMDASQLLPSGSMLLYYDENDGYTQLDGREFRWGEEYWLYIGDSEAPTYPIHGSEIPFWSSSNDQVARIEGGKLICVAAGTTVITAKDKNGTTATAQVTVAGQSFSDGDYLTANVSEENMIIKDDKPYILIFAGESLQLQVKHGNEMLNPSDFTWSGGNGVVQVDEHGKVTRQMIGEGTIKATDQNGVSREVIVVAQNSAGMEFCDSYGNTVLGTWSSPLVLSGRHEEFGTLGDWANYGILCVRPSGENGSHKTSSTVGVYNYLKVTKIEDRAGSTDYGDVKVGVYTYKNEFYSRSNYSHSRFLVSYNGPYGKIGPVELNVVRDKITINVTHSGLEAISPNDRVSVAATATSALGYPIQWQLDNRADWPDSDFDSEGLPISSSYINGWTSNSGATTSFMAQLAMKKDGAILNTKLSFCAWTVGYKVGMSSSFTLYPSLVGATFEFTPIKHDYVTENITLGNYIQWVPSANTLKIGTGCGIYEGNGISSRTKCAAKMTVLYPARSANAYLDGFSLLNNGIIVTATCSEPALLCADNGYFRDSMFPISGPMAKTVYLTRAIQTNLSGSVVLTDKVGNTRTINVLMYPNTVQ